MSGLASLLGRPAFSVTAAGSRTRQQTLDVIAGAGQRGRTKVGSGRVVGERIVTEDDAVNLLLAIRWSAVQRNIRPTFSAMGSRCPYPG